MTTSLMQEPLPPNESSPGRTTGAAIENGWGAFEKTTENRTATQVALIIENGAVRRPTVCEAMRLQRISHGGVPC